MLPPHGVWLVQVNHFAQCLQVMDDSKLSVVDVTNHAEYQFWLLENQF